MSQTTTLNALDLRKEFPRSPSELLGDYVILARTIDKCRAELAGTEGEYHWNCPVAKVFFDFTGIDPMAFQERVAAGDSDADILKWVEEKTIPRTREEVMAWSYDCRHWAPDTVEMKAFLEELRREVAPDKPYLRSFFQVLDAEEGRL